jgi:hypothetical protein
MFGWRYFEVSGTIPRITLTLDIQTHPKSSVRTVSGRICQYGYRGLVADTMPVNNMFFILLASALTSAPHLPRYQNTTETSDLCSRSRCHALPIFPLTVSHVLLPIHVSQIAIRYTTWVPCERFICECM